jgi:hypothetical protein
MTTSPNVLDRRHELPCSAVTANGYRCGSRSSRVREGHPSCVTHDRAGQQFAIWTGPGDKNGVGSKGYWVGTPGTTIWKLA